MRATKRLATKETAPIISGRLLLDDDTFLRELLGTSHRNFPPKTSKKAKSSSQERAGNSGKAMPMAGKELACRPAVTHIGLPVQPGVKKAVMERIRELLLSGNALEVYLRW